MISRALTTIAQSRTLNRASVPLSTTRLHSSVPSSSPETKTTGCPVSPMLKKVPSLPVSRHDIHMRYI